jgi:hypothetical protein
MHSDNVRPERINEETESFANCERASYDVTGLFYFSGMGGVRAAGRRPCRVGFQQFEGTILINRK